jgi:hypothetical protein
VFGVNDSIASQFDVFLFQFKSVCFVCTDVHNTQSLMFRRPVDSRIVVVGVAAALAAFAYEFCF